MNASREQVRQCVEYLKTMGWPRTTQGVGVQCHKLVVRDKPPGRDVLWELRTMYQELRFSEAQPAGTMRVIEVEEKWAL